MSKTGKMNPKLKARWIAALRSGKYKQGRGMLRDCNNNFCCLGVACDIFKDELGLEDWELVRDYYIAGNRSMLPWEVKSYLSLYTTVGALPDEAIEELDKQTLAGLNDCGFTFDQIADVIEKYF